MSFTIYSPTRIVFGRPVSESLPAELDVAHAQRVLLVTDPVLAGLPWVRHIQTALVAADRAVAHFTSVSSNPSTREVSEGLGLAQDERVQAVVALGGGSVIDTAKAIAMLLTNGGTYADYLYTDRPIEQRSRFMIAIPTTAGSGSEVTSTAVVVDPSRAGAKAVRSPLMAPHVALVDPEVTRSLPPATTAATGINAFVQVLEAYVGRQANPYTDPLAVTGMQTVWSYLPRAFAAGDDMTARQGMMLAALWGGLCSDQAGAGLIAALSGTLTAHLQLHNGLTNALLLPHVMRFNLAAIPTVRQQRLNRTLGLVPDASADQLVERLTQFVHFLGLPTHLAELDIAVNDYDWDAIAGEAAEVAALTNNPRAAAVEDCRAILAGCC